MTTAFYCLGFAALMTLVPEPPGPVFVRFMVIILIGAGFMAAINHDYGRKP